MPTAQNPPFTEDGAQSRAVFHLSIRKSGHSTLCPKSSAGSPANQVRVWIIPHLWLLLTTPQDQVGHGASDIDPTAMHKVSLLPTASDQALWAQWQVIIQSVPMLLKIVRCQAASLNSPTMREMMLEKMTMLKKTRVGLRPQVIDRWHQMVKKGRNTLIPKTPSPALARSSVDMRTQTQSLTPERKFSPSSESGTQKAPRRTAHLRNPANHLLRRSCQWTRHSTMRPDKKHGCWTHVSMLGIAIRLLKDCVTGWTTRDTMICDLLEHGKMQANHPDTVGLPLDYMGECQVFDGIWSDIYDLCRFYTLGTTGDPPEFPHPGNRLPTVRSGIC